MLTLFSCIRALHRPIHRQAKTFFLTLRGANTLDGRDKEQRLVYYVSKAMTNAVHQDGTDNFGLKKRYSETLPVFPSLSEVPYSLTISQYPLKKGGGFFMWTERPGLRLDLTFILSAAKLKICNDSQLIVGQIYGEYETKDERMLNTFQSASKTDISWMHEIETYLRIGELPEESKQAHKIRVQAACYTLIKESLYRRFFGGSYLKCLNDIEAQYVLAKLHEGICGNYIGGHTLTHHAHSQGYYWPP
ncbi:hypothetical protein CK203_082555 [Vitis vinifera]|uniref:Uncharacterized protein n=1 Tax=Vitis vinifera TaxID=29760 RepID=A0A438DJZ7_VITVI|nr:hypothetical protein CK203_082555 [Vitis vinifera]